MTGPPQRQNLIVIGRVGGLARAAFLAARDAGSAVTIGQDQHHMDESVQTLAKEGCAHGGVGPRDP